MTSKLSHFSEFIAQSVMETFNGSHNGIYQSMEFLPHCESSSILSSLICKDTDNEVFPLRKYLSFYKTSLCRDTSVHILFPRVAPSWWAFSYSEFILEKASFHQLQACVPPNDLHPLCCQLIYSKWFSLWIQSTHLYKFSWRLPEKNKTKKTSHILLNLFGFHTVAPSIFHQ